MQERISMIKLREILRLRYENDLNVRDIGLSCNVGRQTVSNYIALAEKAGINWQEDKKLDDNELEAKLYKGKIPKEYGSGTNNRGNKPVPDYEKIDKELRKKHVTLLLLWSEYKQENPDGYQYEMFCLLYHGWKKKLDICMRQDHKAGEKIFIDYSGDKIPIINSATGEQVLAELFVAVWGASNYTYAEATLTQQLPDWIMSHVRAFEYFERVPNVCVPDNLRSGINKACLYEPEINPTYLHLVHHYGTAVIPARPYMAKDKAKAEVGVLIVQRWITAVLRNRKFYSLAELNQAIRELVEKLNTRIMKKVKQSRKELYEMLDKPNALPLPAQRYEYAQWKKCRVNIDYHIEVEQHYYSVPYQLCREVIEVRITTTTIEVFLKGKRITSHIRSFEKYRHTTKPEHMPDKHRYQLECTPTKIIEWAGKIGPNTKELVKKIIESREYPQQGYRSSLGITRLTKYYPVARIEKACCRALKYNLYSYKSVVNILKAKLDQQEIKQEESKTAPIVHENVRGEIYYKQGDLC